MESVGAVLALSSAAGAERAGAAGTGEGARRSFGGEGAAPGPAWGAAACPTGPRWVTLERARIANMSKRAIILMQYRLMMLF